MLSQDLFNKPQMPNKEKIEFIVAINCYADIVNLPNTFRDDINRRKKEQEMLDQRAKEAGVSKKSWTES